MSTKFTKEEIDDLKKAFSICDQDGDGIISTKYLTTIMKSLGQNISEAEIIDLLSIIDDCNGVIDFADFLRIMEKRLNDINNIAEDDYIKAFQELDTEGKGWVKL